MPARCTAARPTRSTRRFPKLLRRVGGYNIDMIAMRATTWRICWSVGGHSRLLHRVELDLQPIPPHRALGICHSDFYQAMDATQHIVKLGPAAVELVDRTMIELARDIAMFRPIVDRFVVGEPEAILLTEFAATTPTTNLRVATARRIDGDLGFPGAVVRGDRPGLPERGVDRAQEGLNIMMSMKGDGKPISLSRLRGAARRPCRVHRPPDTGFPKHGTSVPGTHASVGCLHVRR